MVNCASVGGIHDRQILSTGRNGCAGDRGGDDVERRPGGAAARGRRDRGRRRHRRRGLRTERTRSGRLGDRRDDRPSDEVRQDRRHRRSRPVSRARSAEGELLGVGPRIWPGRFGEGHGRAGQGGQPDGDRRAGREGRGPVLPGGLLVLADARARTRRSSPATGADRQRHQPEHARPGRLDPEREVGRLPRLPSAGQQGDARDPARARRVPDDRRRVGTPCPVGAGRRADGWRAEPVRPRADSR